MSRHRFSLSNLDKLNFGIIDEAFGDKIREAAHDCQERPGENRPRKITLTLEIRPASSGTVCDYIEMESDISSKLPSLRAATSKMSIQSDNSLVFHEDFADDPDQNGLFDEQEETNKKGRDK